MPMQLFVVWASAVIAPCWEESLDYLMSEKYFEPSAMDSYFEKRDKPTVFLVLGKEVVVDSEPLATALSRLPKLRREVLLLYYFIGYRDEAIGRLYGRCRSSINRRRKAEMERLIAA
jgi:DNA-directed RNA polymerase specialized sigma24 family protein